MNRGLGNRERRRENVGERGSRKDDRQSGSPGEERKRTGEDPGWRESVIQRSARRRKVVSRSWNRGRNGHRILRRVSYRWKAPRSSGSIACHEAVWKGGFGSSFTTSTRERDPRGRERGEPAKAGHGSGKREKRQGCQRLDRSERRGKTTPTPVYGSREVEDTGQSVFGSVRQSGLGRREASGPSVQVTWSPRVHGHPHGESRGVSRERTRCGCTQVRMGGRNRLDASRVF